MAEIQTTIKFPVRKRASTRRKAVKVVDEEEKENSPNKKIQLERPPRLSSIKVNLEFQTNPIKSLPSSSITKTPEPIGINYKKTKQALHTSVPDWLVGRNAQSISINDFLKEHVGNMKPGSLYVSGAPGTGKTAVLLKAIEALTLPCIKLFINCMTHKNGQSIFNAIKLDLTETKTGTGVKKPAIKKSSGSKDVAGIEEFLTSSELPVILVLDEIDSLDSRNQEVLYTIFEWPALENSKLVLVGVANSLDLTDRILPRLQARKKCKPQLLNFPPYDKDEIAKIILQRLAKLGGESAIDPISVHFCARKLSSMSGDLRMALDVCRRSVELVEMEEKKPLAVSDPSVATSGKSKGKRVGLSTILKVINEVYGQKVVMKSESPLTIPLQQMLAICTLLLMGKSKKSSKEVNFAKFHENYMKVCKKSGLSGVERSEFLSLCISIEDRSLMTIKKAKEVRLYKMSLRVDEMELESVIQDKTLLSSILMKGLD